LDVKGVIFLRCSSPSIVLVLVAVLLVVVVLVVDL
jgi:hypothetical protein